MAERVLITGGEGFIGRHLARALLGLGHQVISLDAMIAQVHGSAARARASDVELVRGDVRDAALVQRVLEGGVDAVVHLAADVGVGQSMYAIERYVGVNDLGTAVLLEALVRRPVRRLVVASSMSVYGEGLYLRGDGGVVETARRDRPGASPLTWDPLDADGAPLVPRPTPEWKRPDLASIYALTKFAQERMCLIIGDAYGIETTALRLFNVYGPGQALSNPYTGVLAIFAQRLLNREPPLVFEDGLQRRDFVHVSDVVAAMVLALFKPASSERVFNVGCGESATVADVARDLARAMDREDIEPQMLGRARKGDVRHCFADITAARDVLGFYPTRRLKDELPRLAEWVKTQRADDLVPHAARELEVRGLVA